MERILEPVFLNEKMLLNTAAHLFNGYALKEEIVTDKDRTGGVKASLGDTFLSKIISPISVSGEVSSKNSSSIKSERLYTLGGLHMSVLKKLKKSKQLTNLNLNEKADKIKLPSFLSANVILKPVDFYETIQLLSLLRPLLVKLFDQFGDQLLQKHESLKILNAVELKKYDKLIKSLLNSLENDYLKSRQLEMVMISPKTLKPIGVLDIPLDNIDPVEMKSKLNDNQFHIVGKLTRLISNSDTLSLVQRTSLSKIIELLGRISTLPDEDDIATDFNNGLMSIKPYAKKLIQLEIPGPCVRLLALSVSA